MPAVTARSTIALESIFSEFKAKTGGIEQFYISFIAKKYIIVLPGKTHIFLG
jgi:hypothetical protein